LVFIYFISFGGFVALTAYLPVFNTEYHGTSGRVAGTFTASYSILASLSRTATGKHVDKIGGGKCTAMGLGWILLGSVLLGSSSPMDVHTFYQYGGLFCMGFGSGFTNAAVYKWIPKVEPTGKAQVGGLVCGVGAFGGFVFPLFLGYSKDNFENGQARGVFTYSLFSIIGIMLTICVINSVKSAAEKNRVHPEYEVTGK
jgi:NNP family nitrate/nitrite transporter-like MFS transporter